MSLHELEKSLQDKEHMKRMNNLQFFIENLKNNEEIKKHLKTFGWNTAELFVAFLIGVIAIIQPDVINPVGILVLAGLSSVLLQVSKYINKKL